MSTSATEPVSTSPSADAFVHRFITLFMIGHTFLTLLLPLLIALFYFSTPRSHHSPIFALNVVTITFAIVEGIMIDALAIHSILAPRDPWPQSVCIVIGTIGIVQSLLVDLALLVRLISVRTLRNLGPKRFALLTALPFLLKILRIVNLILFIIALSDANRALPGTENINVVWVTMPYLKIEWSAQTVDNAYASLAFFFTLRDRGNDQGITDNMHSGRVTFAQRLRAFLHLVLSNFVVPAAFSIVQLVAALRSVDMEIVDEIVLVNNMLAVFGVVFATVWARNVGLPETSRVNLWEDDAQMDNSNMAEHNPRTSDSSEPKKWRVTGPPTAVMMVFNNTGLPSDTATCDSRDA